MKRPKILRILNRFNLGGPTYNVAYLTKYLESDFETVLIGGEPEKGEESSLFILEKLGLQPLFINEMRRSLNPFFDFKAYQKIKHVIREFKPDIVHTHASKAGTLGRLAAFQCKVPVTVHTFHGHVFHSYFNPITTSFFKSVERYLAKKTTAIVAISEIQKHELCNVHKVCSTKQTHVVPLGFDLSRFQLDNGSKRLVFRKKYGLEDGDFAIGLIGRLVPIKNHELFFRSLSLLKHKGFKRIKSFIIGDGHLKTSLMQLAHELGLSVTDCLHETNISDVNFYSWSSEIESILPGLDLVCLSSLNEGTPVSLIEAQAVGLPVVSTNVGGVKDIVCLEGGKIVEGFDPINFSEAIAAVISEGDKIHKSESIRKGFVSERFHYTRLMKDTSSLYHSLLS